MAGLRILIGEGGFSRHIPVVVQPEGEVAGDGCACGVGDVEANLKRLPGVPPGRDKTTLVGRLVEADESHGHAIARIFRREEGKGRERGKDRRDCGGHRQTEHDPALSIGGLQGAPTG